MSLLGALWLPIVLSAVLVFIVSAIIHMVLKYHNSDYKRLPNEDAVRAAIRERQSGAAAVHLPLLRRHEGDGGAGDAAEVHRGAGRGAEPQRPGPADDGAGAAQWFLFILVVSFFIAYVAAHALAPGAPYLQVFRVVGAVGFLAYAAGQVPASIWMGKPWSVAWKEVFDGLMYGLVTAGTFGWLWPR